MTTKLKKIIIVASLAITLTACGILFGRTKSETEVYICTGPQSKRYHKTENCMGLNSCSRSIEKLTVEEAKKMMRTPCGYCY